MSDEDLVKAIRREHVGSLHDFVSSACVHRDHGHCPDECDYCATRCLCVCHRWPVPIGGVAVEKR